MRTVHPATAALVAAALTFLSFGAHAASAFDGTWKTNLQHMTLSPKPTVYLLTKGEFTCSSCVPKISVKADGTDQKVTGHPYDTLAVTVDGNSAQLETKLQGKVLFRVKLVSSGDSMARESTDFGGAQPFIERATYRRLSAGPPDSQALSGSWRLTRIDSQSGAGASITYGMTDDGFTMSSNGQSYAAKFDDKKYPLTGDPTHVSVTVKKRSATQVEERDYRAGKLIETLHLTVSGDGKTLHGVDTVVRTGRVTRFTMDKQ